MRRHPSDTSCPSRPDKGFPELPLSWRMTLQSTPMNRPLLEISSWVAGIVGAAIAGIALVQNFNQPTPTVVASQPRTAKQSPTIVTDGKAHYEIASSAKLQQTLNATRDISDRAVRDIVLRRFVRQAIFSNDLEIAKLALDQVHSDQNHDDAASLLSCYTLYLRPLGQTIEVAKMIRDQSMRDSVLAVVSGRSVAIAEGQIQQPICMPL